MLINIYFEDLKPETQERIIEELRRELAPQINEAQNDNPDLDPATVEQEIIDDYINCHNFANSFYLGPIDYEEEPNIKTGYR